MKINYKYVNDHVVPYPVRIYSTPWEDLVTINLVNWTRSRFMRVTVYTPGSIDHPDLDFYDPFTRPESLPPYIKWEGTPPSSVSLWHGRNQYRTRGQYVVGRMNREKARAIIEYYHQVASNQLT